MAIPTYNELLAHYDLDSSTMRETFDDKRLRQFSLILDVWETLAKFLEMPNSDIMNIKSQGDVVVQKLRILECWKQRRGSLATYEAMVKALLQISRTDLAEKVITLRKSSRPPKANQILPCSKELSLTAPTSPASSSGIEDPSSPLAMSPVSPPANPSEYTTQVTSTLRELEEEFYDLVIYVEDTLEKSEVKLNTIIRRFRMLPQSVRRQHQTDENYKETRRRILRSKTVKKLFDNLTELKHWNYMTPDTLAHILKDVKIDDVHKKIDKYKGKLRTFKANTKLKEMIGIRFPVPDYCMELTMEVEGWEDKTIEEVENRAVNIVRRAAFSGSPHVSLGWKAVIPGNIKVMFFLTESVKLDPEKIFEDDGIASVQVDGDELRNEVYTKVKYYFTITNHHLNFLILQAASGNSEVPSRLWHKTATTAYNIAGGRDVLILAPDLSLPHPEAVARRPGQLTEEDKLKLQRQGLSPDCQNELAIILARCKLDKRLQVARTKPGTISQKQALEDVLHLLTTTQNKGGKAFILANNHKHSTLLIVTFSLLKRFKVIWVHSSKM